MTLAVALAICLTIVSVLAFVLSLIVYDPHEKTRMAVLQWGAIIVAVLVLK